TSKSPLDDAGASGATSKKVLDDAAGLRPWALRLFAASALATLIVFSAASQKRSDYVLPAWPAASLLVAHLILAGTGRRLVRIAAPIATGAVGLAVTAALAPREALEILLPPSRLEDARPFL